MPEDPTSQYAWWILLRDLRLRELWRFMIPHNLTPKQKRRIVWLYVAILLVEVPLFIYIWTVLNRIAGK
jgi:hypothetical protein